MPRLIPPLLLAVLALALAALLAAGRPYELDLGAPGDTRAAFGFYDAEQGEGATFRWSGPQARLVLHGSSSGPQLLTLRLSGERLVALGQPTLRLEGDAGPLASFPVRPGWRRYSVLLPPGATSDGLGVARALRLHTALSRPGEGGPGGNDERRLGLPLDRATLRPLGGQWPAALARAIALAWLAGLAVAALAWADWLLRPAARPTLWRRAALAVAALGAGLLALAWRDPHALAWALPPPWWGLATATLAGAAVAMRPPGPWRDGRGGPNGTQARGARGRALQAPTGGWIAGAGALAAGAALLWVSGPLWLGAPLALVGLWALLRGDEGLGAGLWRPARWDLPRGLALAGLGLTVALALALRLYRIGDLPFGLWRDEARHGLFALRIAQSADFRPVYIASERVNMPALGLYPFALALHLWGPHLWTMRAVTAVAGALTVLPLYGVAQRLSGSRAVALGAALLLAVSSWQITISRFSFPTVFDPLLTLSGLWLILLGLGDPARVAPLIPTPAGDSANLTPAAARHPLSAAERGLGGEVCNVTAAPGSGIRRAARPLALLLAGACLGLAAQTYHTGRVAPAIGGALALLALFLGPGRPAWPGWRRLLGLLPLALGALLVAGPLLAYAASQPAAFNDRVGAVFVLGEEARKGAAPLAVLDEALRRHLLMFNYLGDANGRHHAPLRPLLDLVAGIGLLAGLVAALRAWRDWRSLFLLAALALGLAPSLLAVDAPHAMRAFGAGPYVYLLAALGWAELLRLAWPRPWPAPSPLAPPSRRPPSPAALGAVGALLALAAALNVWTYFGLMPGDPRVFMGFYPVQSRMGAFVRAAGGAETIYVPREVRDDPSFSFLAAGLPVGAFDPGAPGGAPEPPPAPGAPFLLSGYFAADEAAALAPVLGPGAAPEAPGDPFPDGRGPTFYLYRALGDRVTR